MPDDPATARSRRRRAWDGLALCGLVAVAALVVAALAWTRPTSTASSLPYTQVGHLSYRAGVAPTSIYGTSQVETGQPIYTDVVSTVTIRYGYHLKSGGHVDVEGTEQLVATMSNGQGITRSVPLQASTPFKGAHFSATGTLSLSVLHAVAAAFSKATGGTGTYDVSISPNVEVRGTLGKLPLKTTFDPPVKFSLSAKALTPSGSSSGTASSTAGTGAPTSSGSSGRPGRSTPGFTDSVTGSVTSRQGQPTTLFAGMTVRDTRWLALLVLALAVAAGAFVGWPLLRDATSEDEHRRIVARHGRSLVEVDALPTGPGVVVVEVTSFEGLFQVAQRTECPMLHAGSPLVGVPSAGIGGTGHVYAVVDNGAVYRYADTPAMTVIPALAANGNGNGNGKTAHLVDDAGGQGPAPR